MSKALAVAAAATRGTYQYLLLPEQGAVPEAPAEEAEAAVEVGAEELRRRSSVKTWVRPLPHEPAT